MFIGISLNVHLGGGAAVGYPANALFNPDNQVLVNPDGNVLVGGN